MNKLEIKDKSLLSDFSYHAGVITEFIKDEKDYLLTFADGWEDGRVNEIRMINAEVYNKYELKDRVIYQLGFFDYCEFDPKPCFLELYVWYNDCLTEVVKFRAEDFEIKTYVEGKLKSSESFAEMFKN